mgnify:FL=1
MMILSLQLGHNATAALLQDGNIIGAVSQEKFDNIKNSSAFPEGAIRYLLQEHQVKTLDNIAIAGIFLFPGQIQDLQV